MRSLIIIGKIVYIALEGGFYGIEGEDGRKWYPVDLPEHLKKNGLPVVVQAVEETEVFTTVMWGTPIRILVVLSEE